MGIKTKARGLYMHGLCGPGCQQTLSRTRASMIHQRRTSTTAKGQVHLHAVTEFPGYTQHISAQASCLTVTGASEDHDGRERYRLQRQSETA